MNFDNNISIVMTPYLYAIGAVLSALATPLILKFILVAHTTDCYEKTTLEQAQLTDASKEQAWLLPLLFLVMAVTGAIALHQAAYWLQGLLYLLITWTIIAECFLQYRLRVISDWLPYIIIWLGLLLSIQAMPEVSSKSAILGVFVSWVVANLLYIIAINLNMLVGLITSAANPLLLAVGGCLLGLDKAVIAFLIAIAAMALTMLLDVLPILIMKKFKPGFLGFKHRLNLDFCTVYLLVVWFYW